MSNTRHSNTLFPVFLKLEELQTLIVGGGTVGFEKLNAILNNSPQAGVTLVGEEILETIKTLVQQYPQVVLVERVYVEEDLQDKDLVIIATDNKILNADIKAHAKARKILANVADTPALCDFYLSSIVQKGYLKIGISTNGQSPTIAKRLKAFLNDIIPIDINESLENLYQLRTSIGNDFANKIKELNKITAGLVSQMEKGVSHNE